MTNNDFIQVAKKSEIPDPGSTLAEVNERLVVVFHIDGQFYALDDVCTHDGGPLSDGTVARDHTIACPRHGAKFDVRSGAALTMPATQATVSHEVRLDGDDVMVRIRENDE